MWHGGEVEKGGWKKIEDIQKLEVMGKLMDCECKERCVEIDYIKQRKRRGGTAELRSETGPGGVG